MSHAIGIRHFFWMLSKDVISNVELATCERCGVTFAPKLQTAKLQRILTANEIEMALLSHCNRCKKIVGRKSNQE